MDLLPRFAGEPLTPRGVAAYARTSTRRLWLVQLIVAGLAAAAFVWFLHTGCFPTIREAVRRLPETGVIRSQRLEWSGPSPLLLAEGRFLAFSVDLDHTGDIRSPAHLQVEFGREGLLTHSLLGYAEWPYPDGWIVAFNRPETEPWWLAREWAVLALAALGVVVAQLLTWTVLALLYAGPAWLISFYANRDLKLAECWRLSGASLMPGAIVMTLAVFLYGLGLLDLVAVGFVIAGHFVLGWIYLFFSVLFLPRIEAAQPEKKNPFASKTKS